MKIGVISDTHGFFHPEIPEVFSGVERIIHAGDIGSQDVLSQLEKIAPVICVSGNHEPEQIPSALPDFSLLELASKKIILTHSLTTMSWRDFKDALERSESSNFVAEALGSAELVIFGHTHFPLWEQIRGIYFLNPGYAGPDAKEAEPTVATLVLKPKLTYAKIVKLGKKS